MLPFATRADPESKETVIRTEQPSSDSHPEVRPSRRSLSTNTMHVNTFAFLSLTLASTVLSQCPHTIFAFPLSLDQIPGFCISRPVTVTQTSTVDCGSCTAVTYRPLGLPRACPLITTGDGTQLLHTAVCSNAQPTGITTAETTATDAPTITNLETFPTFSDDVGTACSTVTIRHACPDLAGVPCNPTITTICPTGGATGFQTQQLTRPAQHYYQPGGDDCTEADAQQTSLLSELQSVAQTATEAPHPDLAQT